MHARLTVLDHGKLMQPSVKGPVDVRPGFLSTNHGHLHLVEYFPSACNPPHTVLLVPPFAEEMNHSRRMLHLLGYRLAAQGYRALSADLYGTGDSSGTFEQASWSVWLENLAAIRAWADSIAHVKAIVALRFGALLAASHQRLRPVERLIFWDPVMRGQDQLREFLRLRVLADQFRGNVAGVSSVKHLEARLAAGETLQVAGYALSGELASAMGQQDLVGLLSGTRCRVDWLQMGAAEEAPLTPAAAAAIGALRSHGIEVSAAQIPGPKFWATTVSAIAPVLIDATEQLLST